MRIGPGRHHRIGRGGFSARELGRSVWAGLPDHGAALWVVAALAGAMVPLPTALVDVLLTLSLAGSLGLLVASLQARRSSDLPGFPRWLLLVTLSRVALNVTTTRLILTRADAGSVVDSFATLVIGGELLVGAAIFAILTAVQLAVVARGAERIAEVGARFSLDGLPGHQAAIEADLKAGAITAGEAAERRARLLERSNFHGKMDGAARFVRGDAIVAVVVVAIDLVVGTAVGVGRGLPVGEALEVYGRLAIGDGLVTLLPALLVGLAAAVLVARVDSEGAEARPRGLPAPGVLAVPAGLLAGLSLLPGTPRVAFAGTAAGLFALAGLAWARRGPTEERRIVVWLGGHAPGDIAALRRPLAEVRRRCAAALAVEVPEIVAAAAREPDAPAIAVRLGERLLAVPENMVDETGGMGQDATVVAVFRAVIHHAELLVDLEGVTGAIEALRAERPAAVREALRAVGPAELLELVRGFLRERVPAPPLSALLEAVAVEPLLRQASERGRWSTALRERLAGYFVRDVVAGWARLGPVVWARPRPDAEAALLGLVVAGEAGARLKLSPAGRRGWWAQVLGCAPGEVPPIVVCTSRARPAFALLLARVAPHVAVLAAAELQAVDLPVPGEPGGPVATWFDAPAETRGLTRAGVAGEAAAA